MESIWDKYEELGKLGSGSFGSVYKAKNKLTGTYVAIKEIIKSKYNSSEYLSEAEMMKKVQSENSVNLIETFETKYFFYLIMELCIFNLDEYMKIRNEPLSIDEIKEILFQLNNILKTMKEKSIIHNDLKPSNILISLEKINKIQIKLSDFGSSNNLKEQSTLTKNGTPFTMAPEVLENSNFSEKSDIWSLGIIIYYLLFNEYPYNGKTEVQINNDIHSAKKLKKSNDDKLNDLINKMLCIEPFNRINWEMYFNHPFFFNLKKNKNEIKFPEFETICKIHNTTFGGYCNRCKVNFCELCYSQHSSHSYEIFPFYKIGMNSEEKKLSEDLINNIEENIKNLTKIKNDIRAIIAKIKNKSDNIGIYNFDKGNNFKNYYMECLKIISENTFIENNIKLLDVNIWIKESEKIHIQF